MNNEMNTVMLILQGINLVGTILPSTLQAALDLQKIFAASGSDYTTQIQVFQDGAIKSATDTVAMIDEWKKANNYV